MSVAAVIYRLECQHLVLGAPNTREKECVYCNWEKKRTVDIVIKEWHAYCTNVTCRYGRWAGLSESHARHLALRHTNRNPGHKAIHKAEVRKDSVKVRDSMRKHQQFYDQEATEES